ncbi:endo-1,3-alpha-glucanase family glycosylhydrolase [Flammeovirga sp. SubArs3]|uniref:endo-1,3-alpha-glucanase family glycosylhydrolase n=1 Tax=Flammeovirga sp. SubArs3 TaxID=2995316 RepID=UPI00248B3916|nr:endo-1,3-alpha-glucanase family glycosylhydrolase [Flammeovirga sp. SubArs3]
MKQIILLSFLLVFTTLSNSIAQTSNYFTEKLVFATNHPILNYGNTTSYLKGMRYETLMATEEDSLVGRYRSYLPQVSQMTNPMPLNEAVEFEMRTAKSMGVDGFKFFVNVDANKYYLNRFIDVIIEYVTVASRKDIDFQFSVCINFPKWTKRRADYLKETTFQRLDQLFKRTNYSKLWLRNNKNEIVVFTTESSKIIQECIPKRDVKYFLDNPAIFKKIAGEYDEIEKRLGTPISIVYHSSFPPNVSYNHLILDHFPALSCVKYSQFYDPGVESIRKICKQRKRPFIQHVFPDQLSTQMILKENDKKVAEKSKLSYTLKKKDVYLKSQSLKLTQGFRDLLGKAVSRDADFIDVSSWNLYEEGSHLAPEMHHGYANGLLLKYYKNIWKTGVENIEKEFVITSYKSYNSTQRADTDIEVRTSLSMYPDKDQDSIEVVTVLNYPADVYCNNKYLGEAKKGISAFYAPKKIGTVTVEVKRKNKVVIGYETPKAIISSPKRMDWLTYSFCNLDEELARDTQNYILDNEMKHMRKRFLLSKEQQGAWRIAAYNRYQSDLLAAQQFGQLPDKYLAARDKNEKKYRADINKIIKDLDYEVWLELEEKAKSVEGIQDMMMPSVLPKELDGYNILPVANPLNN